MDLPLRFGRPDANMGSGQTPPPRITVHIMCLILQEGSPCNMVGLAADKYLGHPLQPAMTTLTPVIRWTYVCLCGHALARSRTSQRHTVRGEGKA